MRAMSSACKTDAFLRCSWFGSSCNACQLVISAEVNLGGKSCVLKLSLLCVTSFNDTYRAQFHHVEKVFMHFCVFLNSYRQNNYSECASLQSIFSSVGGTSTEWFAAQNYSWQPVHQAKQGNVDGGTNYLHVDGVNNKMHQTVSNCIISIR